MAEYLAMGGYGFYVWGAYGVAAVVLAIEVITLRARRRRAVEHARDGAYDVTGLPAAEVGR